MQMLEVKRDELHQLLESIRNDPRHCNLRVLIEGPTHRRVFSDWGMVVRDFEAELLPQEFMRPRQRSVRFTDLADDPRLCFAFITAHAVESGSSL